MAQRTRQVRRYWLSYDLAFTGDFEVLYRWLDEKRAEECGQSAATFRSSKSREALAEEIAALKLPPRVRVYLIEGTRGSFAIGGRRRKAPWAGYATEAAGVDV